MATIYFISESYLKEQSVINLNVETALINRSILDAQTIHIQTVLGSNLYKKIETLISSGDIALSANVVYKSLLDDYIVQTLVHWTMYETLPYLRYKLMNKGVQNQNSENSEPADSGDVKYFQSSIKNKAEFYTQRLADHLLCNTSLYPEYTTGDMEDMQPNTKSYFSGLQLDEDKSIFDKEMGYNTGIRKLNI